MASKKDVELYCAKLFGTNQTPFSADALLDDDLAAYLTETLAREAFVTGTLNGNNVGPVLQHYTDAKKVRQTSIFRLRPFYYEFKDDSDRAMFVEDTTGASVKSICYFFKDEPELDPDHMPSYLHSFPTEPVSEGTVFVWIMFFSQKGGLEIRIAEQQDDLELTCKHFCIAKYGGIPENSLFISAGEMCVGANEKILWNLQSGTFNLERITLLEGQIEESREYEEFDTAESISSYLKTINDHEMLSRLMKLTSPGRDFVFRQMTESFPTRSFGLKRIFDYVAPYTAIYAISNDDGPDRENALVQSLSVMRLIDNMQNLGDLDKGFKVQTNAFASNYNDHGGSDTDATDEDLADDFSNIAITEANVEDVRKYQSNPSPHAYKQNSKVDVIHHSVALPSFRDLENCKQALMDLGAVRLTKGGGPAKFADSASLADKVDIFDISGSKFSVTQKNETVQVKVGKLIASSNCYAYEAECNGRRKILRTIACSAPNFASHFGDNNQRVQFYKGVDIPFFILPQRYAIAEILPHFGNTITRMPIEERLRLKSTFLEQILEQYKNKFTFCNDVKPDNICYDATSNKFTIIDPSRKSLTNAWYGDVSTSPSRSGKLFGLVAIMNWYLTGKNPFFKEGDVVSYLHKVRWSQRFVLFPNGHIRKAFALVVGGKAKLSDVSPLLMQAFEDFE